LSKDTVLGSKEASATIQEQTSTAEEITAKTQEIFQ